MNLDTPIIDGGRCGTPRVLPMRQRDSLYRQVLEERLDSLLPAAMRDTGIDMWLVVCQEDDLDPVFRTMMPMFTWCPILQILIFSQPSGADTVERVNLSMTKTGGLYREPWTGRHHEEQWRRLAEIVSERDPQRIGINVGSVQWAAGGLTHNLYTRLCQALPAQYVDRLVSAEPLATRWLATLTDREIGLYDHVAHVAHSLIAESYSPISITPGVTTTDDLEYGYWQRATDLGLPFSFKPFVNLVRSTAQKEAFGSDDRTIRPGDLIHCDVGIRYLGLISDHQEWCYIRRPGESDVPADYVALLAQANRLQDVFMASFEEGLTGNDLLQRILQRASQQSIPGPRVYSHSLGHLLHEPGPLIGLPWEQTACPGRGDVPLGPSMAFTMELSVGASVAEWGGEELTLSIEEDVVYTSGTCRLLDGRQKAFYIV